MSPAVARLTALGEVVQLGDTLVRISGHLELLHVDGGLRPIRLPRRYWSHFPPQSAVLQVMVTRPSGVRVQLQTAARRISMRFRSTAAQFGDAPVQPQSFVLITDGMEIAVPGPIDATQAFSADGEDEGLRRTADQSTVTFGNLPAHEKIVEIWLPQMQEIDLLSVDGDAPIAPAPPSEKPVWVHHGSSISHGAELPLPTSAWPQQAARLSGLEVINLGFAGQSMLDPFVADAIAATATDIITLELGINIVGARATDQRTFVPTVHGFLDRIRAGHPDTPIVVVSPILWPGNEDAAGPAGFEDLGNGMRRLHMSGTREDVDRGALSLSLAREHLRHVAEVRSSSGESTFYLNGLELYGERDQVRYPLPDGLHPDAELHSEIARRFERHVFAASGLVPVPND